MSAPPDKNVSFKFLCATVTESESFEAVKKELQYTIFHLRVMGFSLSSDNHAERTFR
jgi:hypothetical protein